MKALPADFDLSPLVGRGLVQVRLDQFQVQLLFDPDHISVEGKLTLESPKSAPVELFNDGWKTSNGLEQLVGQEVTAWSRRGSHSFQIAFSSGAVLVFEGEDGPFEDIVIMVGNNTVVL
jgi:hypothetical protein